MVQYKWCAKQQCHCAYALNDGECLYKECAFKMNDLYDAQKEAEYWRNKCANYEHTLIALATADYVKVVRCKDCKWSRGGFCNNLEICGCDFNDFCSWGERIEDADK